MPEVITVPKPSLCDNCISAGIVEGGTAHLGHYDCPQRYCSVLDIAIHFSGKQECEEQVVRKNNA